MGLFFSCIISCESANNIALSLISNVEIRLGWFSSHPARSYKHIRDFGSSKGDGEYWIDPENDGNPFQVFCDMITDGGSWNLCTLSK